MNRLVLDQGLAANAARTLREQGWDAIHLSEIGMQRADDLKILEWARDANRICVTLDTIFTGILLLPGTALRQ